MSAEENAGNPHYLPTASSSRAIRPNELVLLDLWGKMDRPGRGLCRYHMDGVYRPRVPERYANAFAAVAAARDAAVALVQRAAAAGQRAARLGGGPGRGVTVLRGAGYGEQILHRTGHSLGESVHGNGVNMDDYETHDDRRLLAGTGFTIEPGSISQSSACGPKSTWSSAPMTPPHRAGRSAKSSHSRRR